MTTSHEADTSAARDEKHEPPIQHGTDRTGWTPSHCLIARPDRNASETTSHSRR